MITYKTEEEAIRIANDSIYGLGGGVITGNTARGFNVARQIRAGNVSVQTVGPPTVNVEALGSSGPGWSADQPNGVGITGVFGGFKQSGIGRNGATTELRSSPNSNPSPGAELQSLSRVR